MRLLLTAGLILFLGCKEQAPVKIVNSSYWLSVNEPPCYQVAETPGERGGIYECHFADGHIPSARCLVYARGGISCEYFDYSEKSDDKK